MEPRISVIMSAYHEPKEYLDAAVRSILSQTYSDFEFIILLDAPDNLTLWELLRRFAEEDPRIRLFQNERNLGLTGSLNRGLSFARGEYVARMDADDISAPDRLEKQLSYIREQNLDFIGSGVTDMDENGNLYSYGPTEMPASDSRIRHYMRRQSPIMHPTWFLKRSVYADLGGYREIDACEDYDFLVRAALNGCRFGNMQEPLLRYRINANSISNTKRGLQKTALSLLSAAYRKGRSPSMEEWEAYLDSKAGLKKRRNFERFYAVAADVKKKRSPFYAIWKLTPLLIVSAEARESLWNSLYSRVAKRF